MGIKTEACHLSIDRLPEYCPTIFIEEYRGEQAEIGTVWGMFNLHRQEIQGGVRFALTNCPNAFAWTITTGFPPAQDRIVIHCTINR